jgi:hypothetical protein
MIASDADGDGNDGLLHYSFAVRRQKQKEEKVKEKLQLTARLKRPALQ